MQPRSVDPLAERSLSEQVESYLGRMRNAHPFPVSSDECYFGCVPEAVAEWHRRELFEHDVLPSRVSNLLLTMHQSGDSVGRLRNILHISVEDESDYIEASQGRRGHERIFWIKCNDALPAPRNSTSTPFYLPLNHPHRHAILAWVHVAYKIEKEIEDSLKLIAHLEKMIPSPAVAVKAWPELNNFISWKRGSTNNISEATRKQALLAVQTPDREKITDQLARAVMLPERHPLDAWVRFYTPELQL